MKNRAYVKVSFKESLTSKEYTSNEYIFKYDKTMHPIAIK